ncbi:related to ACOB protein [Phialocephala subalpina]|uniref:Related to ACOB protein n=1 Tax=Phialocephala subalpina TaxID=576137 RepID=A0A1L7WQZ8_9HELO|nr:related to ACOB protein [Phialocephala subalpina]
MEQMKATNALAPFLALTKSASSPRAAADLITRATSAPNTFIFAELLQAPQIQALAESADHASHLTLLKIFSYGTYTDYRNTSSLPALNEAQTLKLRQLSLLTLAKSQTDLSYTSLLGHLGLETTRELEDLVISAIYAGLLNATLDPYHKLVAVSSVAPLRDLPPNSIPQMLSTLSEWSTRCVSTLADLERQIASIKAVAKQRAKEEEEWAATVEKLVEGKGSGDSKDKGKEVDEKSSGSSLFAGLGRKLGAGAASKRPSGEGEEDEAMEVDDEDELTKGKPNAKKRGFGLLGGK